MIYLFDADAAAAAEIRHYYAIIILIIDLILSIAIIRH